MTRERDDSIDALQQTVEAFRESSGKVQDLANERQAVEADAVVQSLRQAKEHLSSAVLDALHQERKKTHSLEQALQVPCSLIYMLIT